MKKSNVSSCGFAQLRDHRVHLLLELDVHVERVVVDAKLATRDLAREQSVVAQPQHALVVRALEVEHDDRVRRRVPLDMLMQQNKMLATKRALKSANMIEQMRKSYVFALEHNVHA